ncbi:multi-sensor signal transduction multi-kinase [Oceanobacillus picturae]|uniref:Multi-sensor signal transduction multi-kinase n=1 Tax=Oceanobacillus picturae TaxID=171693 RepID=W9AI94_9BACI|nr:hypothetical protein [Oceanobacillus picturae]GAQ18761.1 multi-sensor signal transduction multi-kinase [Oceanobacillus picturae]CDO02401.1 hypothetical protein BN988_00862 [Oceanobacillus picturae]
MTELKNFLYELHRYADQTHTLKDAYEKLPEAEKQKVMKTAPASVRSPEEFFHPVFSWLESMHSEFEVENEE